MWLARGRSLLCWAAVVLMSMGVLVGSSPVRAGDLGAFAEIPSDHWSYDALQRLRLAGLLEHGPGTPDLSDHGVQSGRELSRYEMAFQVYRALDVIHRTAQGIPSEDASPHESVMVRRAALEVRLQDWSGAHGDDHPEERMPLVDAKKSLGSNSALAAYWRAHGDAVRDLQHRSTAGLTDAEVELIDREIEQVIHQLDAARAEVPADTLPDGNNNATAFPTPIEDIIAAHIAAHDQTSPHQVTPDIGPITIGFMDRASAAARALISLQREFGPELDALGVNDRSWLDQGVIPIGRVGTPGPMPVSTSGSAETGLQFRANSRPGQPMHENGAELGAEYGFRLLGTDVATGLFMHTGSDEIGVSSRITASLPVSQRAEVTAAYEVTDLDGLLSLAEGSFDGLGRRTQTTAGVDVGYQPTGSSTLRAAYRLVNFQDLDGNQAQSSNLEAEVNIRF